MSYVSVDIETHAHIDARHGESKRMGRLNFVALAPPKLTPYNSVHRQKRKGHRDCCLLLSMDTMGVTFSQIVWLMGC
jgi:hypothetical protein